MAATQTVCIKFESTAKLDLVDEHDGSVAELCRLERNLHCIEHRFCPDSIQSAHPPHVSVVFACFDHQQLLTCYLRNWELEIRNSRFAAEH